MKRKKISKEDIIFKCIRCGRCCTFEKDQIYVYVNLKDRQRLAKHLKLTTRKFTDSLCTKQVEDGQFYLTPDGPACMFFKKGKCRVYRARPEQCRTWPFWPDYMDEKTWKEEVKAVCPGISQ
jgi:Fe-S-cluster containining protein